MALSQILGGWTKWGWPRFSTGVFVLGFLPVLVAGGWVLLARQPSDWMNTSNWSRDLGIFGVVADVGNTLCRRSRSGSGSCSGCRSTRPGRSGMVVERTRSTAADEPLTADRGPYAEPPTVPGRRRTSDSEADATKPLG